MYNVCRDTIENRKWTMTSFLYFSTSIASPLPLVSTRPPQEQMFPPKVLPWYDLGDTDYRGCGYSIRKSFASILIQYRCVFGEHPFLGAGGALTTFAERYQVPQRIVFASVAATVLGASILISCHTLRVPAPTRWHLVSTYYNLHCF